MSERTPRLRHNEQRVPHNWAVKHRLPGRSTRGAAAGWGKRGKRTLRRRSTAMRKPGAVSTQIIGKRQCVDGIRDIIIMNPFTYL